MASFTKEVNPRLAKRPLKTNGRLANLELTFLVKEVTNVHITGVPVSDKFHSQRVGIGENVSIT